MNEKWDGSYHGLSRVTVHLKSSGFALDERYVICLLLFQSKKGYVKDNYYARFHTRSYH